ncbi:MAG: WD40 repeat domain-containing protein [Saprospiraceae bacterium]|nr:WD40 repeat domain-containing protein [Saprospiraceae bacterium]
MKPLLFALLLFPYIAVAQDCTPTRYGQLMREADEATFGKKPDYQLAVNKLLSAKTCQPDSEAVVNLQLVKVFEEVNRQRELAVRNEREATQQRLVAEKSARSSYNSALALRTLKTDATLALRIADYNYRHHPLDPVAKSTFYDIITNEDYGFYAQRYKACHGQIENILCSPDMGLTLISTKAQVSVWNMDGKKLREAPYPVERGAHFSNDGRLFMIDDNNNIVVKDMMLNTLKTFTKDKCSYISDVSSNGQYILAFCEKKEASGIALIDLNSDMVFYPANFTEGTQIGKFLYPHPDSIFLAISAVNETHIYDLQGKEHNLLNGGYGDGGGIPEVEGLPNYNLLGFYYNKFSLINWGVVEIYEDGQEIKHRAFDNHVDQIAFTKDGGKCIVLSNGSIFVWNFFNDKVQIIQNVTCFDLSSDGSFLITGDKDGYVKKWLLSGYESFKYNTNIGETCIGTIAPYKIVVQGNEKKTAYYSVDESGKKTTVFPERVDLNSVLYLNKSRQIVLLTKNATLEIQNENGTIVTQGQLPFKAYSIGASPDEKLIWVTGSEKTILYKYTASKLIHVALPVEITENIVFSNDSDFFISNLNRHAFALFSASGKLLQTFSKGKNTETTKVYPLQFAPDGMSVLSYHYDYPNSYLEYWSLKGEKIKSIPLEMYSPNVCSTSQFFLMGSYYKPASYLYDFDGTLLYQYNMGGITSIYPNHANQTFLVVSDYDVKILDTPDVFIKKKVFKITLNELIESNLQPEYAGTVPRKKQ